MGYVLLSARRKMSEKNQHKAILDNLMIHIYKNTKFVKK